MSFVRELATRLARLSQFPRPVLRLSKRDEIDDDLVPRPRQNADRTQLRDRDCVASDDDAFARSRAIDEPEKLSLSFIDPDGRIYESSLHKDRCGSYCGAAIRSKPTYGRNAAGTTTLPSACW